ncbi:MAG: hypothetical protein LBT40_18525, partial [Deltaproteobacteria bacterium]|nr:hypothetical protein [Deltaproteobacteria bacterium]
FGCQPMGGKTGKQPRPAISSSWFALKHGRRFRHLIKRVILENVEIFPHIMGASHGKEMPELGPCADFSPLDRYPKL